MNTLGGKSKVVGGECMCRRRATNAILKEPIYVPKNGRNVGTMHPTPTDCENAKLEDDDLNLTAR